MIYLFRDSLIRWFTYSVIYLFGDLLGDLLGDALCDLIIGIDVDTDTGIDIDTGIGIDIDTGIGIDIDIDTGIDVDIDIDTGIDVDTDIDTPNTENGIKRCEYTILCGLRCPGTAEIAWQWSNPVTSVSGKIHFWHSHHIM